jgi:uncharacterized protein (DUF433 family)
METRDITRRSRQAAQGREQALLAAQSEFMTFEDIQREYDISVDDIRAALRFVGELAEQESFHPLPAA